MCNMMSLKWDYSSYAVTHLRNKNSNIQGRSPNVVIGETDFPYHKELIIKERIHSSGSKFFPLRGVRILKRDITA